MTAAVFWSGGFGFQAYMTTIIRTCLAGKAVPAMMLPGSAGINLGDVYFSIKSGYVDKRH
jgi:hypothetical protein